MFLVSTDGLDYIKTPVIVRCRSQHLKILNHISVASKLQSSWGAIKKLLPLANATCEKLNMREGERNIPAKCMAIYKIP